MLIYKLTFASGKSYIGQTVRSLKRRLNQHRRAALELGSELAVHHAWRKYGEPIAEVLADAVESEDKLHELERAFIESLGTLSPHGYNLTVGGDFAPSRMPEVARKIGEKSKGREVTAATRAKVGAASREHWQDPQYREKVSAGLRAAVTDEHRQAAAKRSDALWAKRKAEGWTMPEAQREKLRNKVVSDETRARMSEAAKRRGAPKHTPERGATISRRRLPPHGATRKSAPSDPPQSARP